MSNIGDKLQNAFARMARESSANSNSKGSGLTKSPIASSLGKAGNAYQLNDVTEITSGFANLYGNNNPSDSFAGGLFDNLDLAGLADKFDIEEIIEDVDIEGVVEEVAENQGNNDPQAENNEENGGNSQGNNGQGNNQQACQLSGAHQTAFNEITQGLAADYQSAVTALDNASTRTERRNATDDLWTWTRSNFPNMELMQGIAQSQSLTTAQKQYELGRFAVLVLRMEFLIGWSRLEGPNQNSVPTWERSAPDNLDEFYTSNAAMGGGDSAWCSRFAGYARKRLGFRTDLISHLLFNSGLRLYEWAVHDRTHDHKDWSTELGTNGATNNGVLVIPKADFASLVTTLNSSQDTAADVNAFFNDPSRFVPQAGDLCIFGKNGNTWKTGFGSHTTTIEKYDAATQTFYSIEGNFSNRALGRKFDLKDKTITDEILYIIRPGIDQHHGAASFDCVLTQAQINELYQGMENYLDALAGVATAKNYFHHNDNDAMVYTWYTGNES